MVRAQVRMPCMEHGLRTPQVGSIKSWVSLGGRVGQGMSRTVIQSYSDSNSYRHSSIHCVHPIENMSEHESEYPHSEL